MARAIGEALPPRDVGPTFEPAEVIEDEDDGWRVRAGWRL